MVSSCFCHVNKNYRLPIFVTYRPLFLGFRWILQYSDPQYTFWVILGRSQFLEILYSLRSKISDVDLYRFLCKFTPLISGQREYELGQEILCHVSTPIRSMQVESK
ncbi:hypothetical protein BRADI_2g18576v3 [Brachypodium distachyon]|uniref:Uncharacterized protein n=1 Tax=Brachypodium distachyon TaxID=15368 RepID=A0A0Q3IXK6_BRADI|nr:hypothetical protein BRADI_2g18576v3 [Brachypodium distachyon]PNT70815.1 hypothetical protein BRADI_2g18576v3 [Brachypodium distachyon]